MIRIRVYSIPNNILTEKNDLFDLTKRLAMEQLSTLIFVPLSAIEMDYMQGDNTGIDKIIVEVNIPKKYHHKMIMHHIKHIVGFSLKVLYKQLLLQKLYSYNRLTIKFQFHNYPKNPDFLEDECLDLMNF